MATYKVNVVLGISISQDVIILFYSALVEMLIKYYVYF